MSGWQPILFFEDEDSEALKQEFIMLSAKHKGNFDAYTITRHMFKNLREPELRALQAAEVWSKDLEVAEAIRQKIIFGDEKDETERYVKLAATIANDTREAAKDRLNALELIFKVRGKISKPIDMKISNGNGETIGLPIFNIVRDTQNA